MKTVKINGVAKNLEYDAIGNPTTYFNGTVWNFTWQNGRQMATAKNSAGTRDLSFTYGVDGIRTSKTVNGVTHHYINQNGKVIREYWTQNGTEYILDFFYDVNGKPLALYYRVNGASTAYYYQTNLQGDVMKIFKVTSSGGVATATPVASYAYDAWGNVEAVVKASADNNDIANRNPLRYRGYYYDTETKLYYLQSRYYDPALYRFVNADGYASTGTGFLGYNMFAYCGNNTITYYDPTGGIGISVILGIIAIVITLILIPSSESQVPTYQHQAADTYNSNTVNVYQSGTRPSQNGQINAEYYINRDTGYPNITIHESLSINSTYDMEAVLNVIMSTPYYNKELFGSRDYMQAQWLAHNLSYSIASGSEIGFRIMQSLSGASNPIESSTRLDIRSNGNLLRRQRLIYTVISWFI